MTEIASLGLSITGVPAVAQAKKELEGLGVAGEKAEKGTRGASGAFDQMIKLMVSMDARLGALNGHMTGVSGSLAMMATRSAKTVSAQVELSQAANDVNAAVANEAATAGTVSGALVDLAQKSDTAATSTSALADKAEQTVSAVDRLAPSTVEAAAATADMAQEAGKAEGELGKLAQTGDRTGTVFDGLGKKIMVWGAALAAAFSVNALQNYADGWSDMQSRVGSAIKNMEAAPALMQRITDIANASYSPLQQTNEIFGRNVTVLGALGRSATEAADFTEALNHALVTTATKGQDADVVLNSLSRAISNNTLRAMEFETIMSRSPRVLEAIAEEMGTNVIGLRALATQGKVTGKVIVDAMINSLEKLRDEAGAMPATMRDAAMIWNNVFNEVVGRVDQAWQATGRLATKSIELAIAFRGTADNLIRIGNIVGSVVGPAFDMLSANMGTITSVAGVAVAAVAGFYAPAMIGGLWSLSTALVTGVAGGIRAVTAAMLANPLGVLIGGLALGVTAAFLFRDKIKDAIGVDVVEVFRDGANTIIGAMVGAVDASKAAFEVFPDFMAGLGARAWNSFLEGFEGSAVSWTNPFTGETFDLLNINLSTFKKDVGGAGGAAMDAVSQAFQKAQGHDYVGAIASSLGEVWENASGAGDAIGALADQVGGAAGSMSGLSEEAQKQADTYAKIVRGAQEFIAGKNLEQQALGMTAEAAARMRYEQDLLNKAANDNIKLSSGQRSELMGLAAQMAAVEEATRRVTEIYNFGKDVFTGFFGDLKSGITEGKSLWESLGNAGANALDKIADRALSMAANGIFDMIFGAVMGGIGGGFGTIGVGGVGIPSGGFIPSLTGPKLFAAGGYTGDMATNAAAGIVHGQEFVLNAAATRNIGLPTLNAMNAGYRPAANQNQANDNGTYNFNMTANMQIMPGATEADGAAFARGWQAEMKRWQSSGEGRQFVNGVVNKSGRY